MIEWVVVAELMVLLFGLDKLNTYILEIWVNVFHFPLKNTWKLEKRIKFIFF